MDYFPAFIALKGQPCLVVGGGEVAARKIHQLLKSGAAVTVNAPVFHPAVEVLATAGRISVRRTAFEPDLVAGHWLVIAATSDPATNRAVAATARKQLRLCNVVDDPDESSFISPSVVDRSPIIVAVSSGGSAPVLARMVRQQLERLLPLGLADLGGWARRWRGTVRARFASFTERRRFWERVFAGRLVEDIFAGRLDAADAAITAELDGTGPPVPAGIAWLVGAGPGDPELLTLRGFQVLQHADVVLHDRLVSPRLLDFARRDAELIDVGKTGGGPSTSQEEINRLLVERVRSGQRVCRLKGGDPFVFGRGGEEAEALAELGLAFQIVPGITAAIGCGAYAGIPLTHREQSSAVTFVTAQVTPGHRPPDWQALAALRHTLVVYMLTQRLGQITDELAAAGRATTTPAAVVTNGTTDQQRVIVGTLGDIAARAGAAGALSPALLFVGEVVSLSGKLAGSPGWSAAVGSQG